MLTLAQLIGGIDDIGFDDDSKVVVIVGRTSSGDY